MSTNERRETASQTLLPSSGTPQGREILGQRPSGPPVFHFYDAFADRSACLERDNITVTGACHASSVIPLSSTAGGPGCLIGISAPTGRRRYGDQAGGNESGGGPSGQQYDLPMRVPLLELRERVGDPVERVGRRDRELQLPGRDQVRHLGQYLAS
jgi:hypothetical protein